MGIDRADGGKAVAVARLQFGNVVILPQPMASVGEDVDKIVHGGGSVPAYPYVASYLWTRKAFGADALLHFGTHGSLEFMPGKQLALSDYDWTDALIGDVPHFYIYTISNIGEGVIAKRRSYATLLSHLTAPFMQSGLYPDLFRLRDEIHRMEHLEEGDLQRNYLVSITDLARKTGVLSALSLDTGRTLTAEEVERVHHYVEEIENAKVSDGLYVWGRPYTEAQVRQTARLAFSEATACGHGEARPLVPDSGIAAQVARMEEGLRQSTRAEQQALLAALSGRYVVPSSAGDPIINPAAVPTGKNFYAINPETTPTAQAWQVGRRLAEDLLAAEKERRGHYPEKVSFTLWATDFVSTEGAMVAQIFYLLGVEPIRDGFGNIRSLRLIPLEELGRPRVDVVVQTSGQLRDIAASRLALINKAVAMAAEDGTLSAGKRLFACRRPEICGRTDFRRRERKLRHRDYGDGGERRRLGFGERDSGTLYRQHERALFGRRRRGLGRDAGACLRGRAAEYGSRRTAAFGQYVGTVEFGSRL